MNLTRVNAEIPCDGILPTRPMKGLAENAETIKIGHHIVCGFHPRCLMICMCLMM